MARVNDGSLLQHATECLLAERLAAAGDGRLRLVATHAMAPFEAARNAEVHTHNALARRVLGASAEGAAPGAPAVVRAYAASRATPQHYPNTAELLAALLGREALSGVLCECDPPAAAALQTAWRGSAVHVEARSWREAAAAGALFPPEGEPRPWLLGADPYGWLLDGEVRKEQRGPYLVREDLELLRPVLAAHVRGGAVGACALFVYKADASHARAFRGHALHLADRLGLERAVLGIPAPEGTRHLGVVMSSLENLAAEAAEAWDALRAEE